MKHFYLMHGMMGECPEGDESGAYVSAIDAKSEITDLQRQLADLTKLYEDVRYEHASEKSAKEQLEIQLAEAKERAEEFVNRQMEDDNTIQAMELALEKKNDKLATAQAQLKRLGDIIVWALGYTDFAERKDGQGAYWWRTEMRAKLDKAGFKVNQAKQALEGSNKIVDKSNEITINDGLDD